jgi:hypothetical protein
MNALAPRQPTAWRCLRMHTHAPTPVRSAWQVTKTWTPVGNMSARREAHQLLTLPNGDALACGGSAFDSDTNSDTMLNQITAELYSPSTRTWTPTGSMSVGRASHRAVLLASGNVLVAGGEALALGVAQAHNTAEIYSPATGTWRNATTLPIARDEFSMVTLPSGLVLLSGGISPVSQGTFEPPGAPTINLLYNETADTWTQTGPLLVPDQNGPRSMGFTVLFSSPP